MIYQEHYSATKKYLRKIWSLLDKYYGFQSITHQFRRTNTVSLLTLFFFLLCKYVTVFFILIDDAIINCLDNIWFLENIYFNIYIYIVIIIIEIMMLIEFKNKKKIFHNRNQINTGKKFRLWNYLHSKKDCNFAALPDIYIFIYLCFNGINP